MALQLLLVEDDIDLATTTSEYLAMENIELDHVSNGAAGLNFARSRRYDVIILDISMPKMNGLEMCEAIRREGIDTPVLMLTARDGIDDKLAGFEAGTDDYLVKPFEYSELIARIHSLSKRRSGQSRRLVVADLELDIDRREAYRGKRMLQLSPITWRLLEVLVRESPKTVTKQHLMDALWGHSPPDSNSLKVHLHRLRKQVDSDSDEKLIETVHNQGVALRQK